MIEQQLQAAWHEVDTNWSDDAAHRRFVALCTARGELAEAARCYRRVRDEDLARRESAELRQKAVLAAAMLMLSSTSASEREATRTRRSRTYWLVCGVGAGLCGYVILSVLRLLGR